MNAKLHGFEQLLAAVILISRSWAASEDSKYVLPAELRQSKDTSKCFASNEEQEGKTNDQLSKARVVLLILQEAFPLQRIPTRWAMSALQEDGGCSESL